MTSEDIKHQLIIIIINNNGQVETDGLSRLNSRTAMSDTRFV